MQTAQTNNTAYALNLLNPLGLNEAGTTIMQPNKPVVSPNVFAAAPVVKFDTSISKQFAAKMNVIRFIAMCSIVWGHSIYAWEHENFTSANGQMVQALMLQMGRMGTIMFFVISGFFISDKLPTFTIGKYLKYRLYSLIIPWLIFLSLFVFIQIFHLYPIKQLLTENIFKTAKLTFYLYRVFIFHATYWFIPVSIIAALTLIVCKKYVDKFWFGAILLGITIFYSVNLYHGWLPVDHTKAFFGYTFFMWLGIQFKLHISAIKAFIDKLSWSALITALVLTFILACREGIELKAMGCVDPFASLRLTNSILTLLIFIALLKTNRLQWIKILKPQNYVYGVYLVHCLIISEFLPVVNNAIFHQQLFVNIPKLIAVQFIFFTLMLTITYLVVIAIRKSPLYFTIGRNRDVKGVN